MHQFQVKAIAKTPNPQQLIYLAMHQDYSEDYVGALDNIPSEERCGEIIVDRLLTGDRGHYGPLEHPQITFSCGYFPHSVIQQARTHRIGVSFDVQSFRYTGKHFIDVTDGNRNIESVVYLRPTGNYTDRKGGKYYYSLFDRAADLDLCKEVIKRYVVNTQHGISEEHARGILPFDYRQHFVVSFNLRSFLHFCDLRSKKDAQLEIQKLCELMWVHFEDWAPAVAQWYEKQRLGKGKLAP